MSNRLKKLARTASRNKPTNNSHIVWAWMAYRCKDCGRKFRMYLEKGLEEHGEHHKPVPFSIICPFCDSFHCYDVSGLIPLLKKRPVDKHEHYFKNTKNDDCGIPVHPEYVKRLRRTNDVF